VQPSLYTLRMWVVLRSGCFRVTRDRSLCLIRSDLNWGFRLVSLLLTYVMTLGLKPSGLVFSNAGISGIHDEWMGGLYASSPFLFEDDGWERTRLHPGSWNKIMSMYDAHLSRVRLVLSQLLQALNDSKLKECGGTRFRDSSVRIDCGVSIMQTGGGERRK
jgi:hypothetical protein